MHLVSWIVLLPFLGGLVMALAYFLQIKKGFIGEKILAILGVITPIVSAVLTLVLFFFYDNDHAIEVFWFNWIELGNLHVNMGLYLDHLSLIFTLFITFIASLIHIYSTAYMSGEKGFGKFFCYLNLFVGSMLILVLANNPVMLFLGWEGVGVCSFLLIGFYYDKKENLQAANKAFIMNRIGDFAFIVGLGLLFWNVGRFGFDYESLKANWHRIDSIHAQWVLFCFYVGATAKSAQIPLYTWIADAMAGPTPVSALIHAATMVTAGVYLLSRFSFVYAVFDNIGEIVAYIGTFTALIAALIATRQSDIKKILAYSTVSQLGYMFVALGVGGYSTAIFHTFTHSFFKALLFLGAGAIIYAAHHEQNIFKMGNFKRLKIVFVPFLIATLSIAGIPPFSGFFSKDEILFEAFVTGHYFIWAIACITACITAYYMFRLFFVVFFGREDVVRFHTPPKRMTWVLVLLAFFSAVVGFLNVPEILDGDKFFSKFLGFNLTLGHEKLEVSSALEYILMFTSVAVSVLGIFVAFKKFYKNDVIYVVELEDAAKKNVFVKAAERLFYVDELYSYVLVKPTLKLGSFCVNVVDKILINGSIGLMTFGIKALGFLYAKITQTGYVRMYTAAMVIFVAGYCLYILLMIMRDEIT